MLSWWTIVLVALAVVVVLSGIGYVLARFIFAKPKRVLVYNPRTQNVAGVSIATIPKKPTDPTNPYADLPYFSKIRVFNDPVVAAAQTTNDVLVVKCGESVLSAYEGKYTGIANWSFSIDGGTFQTVPGYTAGHTWTWIVPDNVYSDTCLLRVEGVGADAFTLDQPFHVRPQIEFRNFGIMRSENYTQTDTVSILVDSTCPLFLSGQMLFEISNSTTNTWDPVKSYTTQGSYIHWTVTENEIGTTAVAAKFRIRCPTTVAQPFELTAETSFEVLINSVNMSAVNYTFNTDTTRPFRRLFATRRTTDLSNGNSVWTVGDAVVLKFDMYDNRSTTDVVLKVTNPFVTDTTTLTFNDNYGGYLYVIPWTNQFINTISIVQLGQFSITFEASSAKYNASIKLEVFVQFVNFEIKTPDWKSVFNAAVMSCADTSSLLKPSCSDLPIWELVFKLKLFHATVDSSLIDPNQYTCKVVAFATDKTLPFNDTYPEASCKVDFVANFLNEEMRCRVMCQGLPIKSMADGSTACVYAQISFNYQNQTIQRTSSPWFYTNALMPTDNGKAPPIAIGGDKVGTFAMVTSPKADLIYNVSMPLTVTPRLDTPMTVDYRISTNGPWLPLERATMEMNPYQLVVAEHTTELYVRFSDTAAYMNITLDQPSGKFFPAVLDPQDYVVVGPYTVKPDCTLSTNGITNPLYLGDSLKLSIASSGTYRGTGGSSVYLQNPMTLKITDTTDGLIYSQPAVFDTKTKLQILQVTDVFMRDDIKDKTQPRFYIATLSPTTASDSIPTLISLSFKVVSSLIVNDVASGTFMSHMVLAGELPYSSKPNQWVWGAPGQIEFNVTENPKSLVWEVSSDNGITYNSLGITSQACVLDFFSLNYDILARFTITFPLTSIDDSDTVSMMFKVSDESGQITSTKVMKKAIVYFSTNANTQLSNSSTGATLTTTMMWYGEHAADWVIHGELSSHWRAYERSKFLFIESSSVTYNNNLATITLSFTTTPKSLTLAIGTLSDTITLQPPPN